MAQRKFTLSEEAVGQIIRREQVTREAVEVRRLQVVRLYGSGEDMSVIERISGASERTIRRWVERYVTAGLAGLKLRWRGGNHRGLSAAQRTAVGKQLRDLSPAQVLGTSSGAFWTVEDVQRFVQQQYGVTYRSVRSYHSLLKESGLSDQRPEGIYRSRPSEAAIAQWEAEAEKK